MPTADTAPQGPGLQEAANAFTGLLDRESGTPAPGDDAEASEALEQGDGDADAEALTDETQADTEVEAEPEGDEAADTSDDAAQEGEPQKETALHTVKVGGKEQVTLDELLKGYSRTRDYTQKTDALATDRHVLLQEKSAVQAERAQYASLLTALQQQLQSGQQQEPDWDALYQHDPLLWAKTRDEWRDRQDKLAAANFELQRLAHVQGEEQKAALEGQLIDGRKKMLEMNPAWKDAKAWDADRVRIIEYGRSIGYTPEEIAQAYDPRAIVVLDKARRWDEAQANKPKPTTQRTGPQVARAGSAPVANNMNQRARQRLAQTGRVEDAAKVFMGLIE